MIRIRGLDHVVIRVREVETMIAFYCDVLGCSVERRLPDEVGLVQLRAGVSQIDLVSVDGAIGKSGGAAPSAQRGGRNMDHFCVRLEEFDEGEIRRHLERHGVSAGNLESRLGAEGVGPSIYIQDPEDNTVELKGPPAS